MQCMLDGVCKGSPDMENEVKRVLVSCIIFILISSLMSVLLFAVHCSVQKEARGSGDGKGMKEV